MYTNTILKRHTLRKAVLRVAISAPSSRRNAAWRYHRGLDAIVGLNSVEKTDLLQGWSNV